MVIATEAEYTMGGVSILAEERKERDRKGVPLKSIPDNTGAANVLLPHELFHSTTEHSRAQAALKQCPQPVAVMRER